MAAATVALQAPSAQPPAVLAAAAVPVAAPRPARHRPSVTALSRRMAAVERRLQRYIDDGDEDSFAAMAEGGVLDSRYFRLRREMIRTPAASVAEVLTKARMLLPDEMQAHADDEAIVAALVADLERLARG